LAAAQATIARNELDVKLKQVPGRSSQAAQPTEAESRHEHHFLLLPSGITFIISFVFDEQLLLGPAFVDRVCHITDRLSVSRLAGD